MSLTDTGDLRLLKVACYAKYHRWMTKQRVAVLGASPKSDRASNKSINILLEKGYDVIPVHPAHDVIAGMPVTKELSAIDGQVATLTIYVGPRRSEELLDQIIALSPVRVILNPGAESNLVESRLNENGILVIRACTLMMLKSGRFGG